MRYDIQQGCGIRTAPISAAFVLPHLVVLHFTMGGDHLLETCSDGNMYMYQNRGRLFNHVDIQSCKRTRFSVRMVDTERTTSWDLKLASKVMQQVRCVHCLLSSWGSKCCFGSSATGTAIIDSTDFTPSDSGPPVCLRKDMRLVGDGGQSRGSCWSTYSWQVGVSR